MPSDPKPIAPISGTKAVTWREKRTTALMLRMHEESHFIKRLPSENLNAFMVQSGSQPWALRNVASDFERHRRLVLQVNCEAGGVESLMTGLLDR